MANRRRLVLVMVIVLAAAFRTYGLFANTFQADEALFASWARQIAVWRDPLLVSQVVDKPPLLFYVQAAFYPLMGPVMWAARLPNYVASLLIIPLTAILAWRLYRNQATMILAAAMVAFSPIAIQFSSSAFIDPLMSCLIVSSLVVVAGCQEMSLDRPRRLQMRGQLWMPALAGILFGLAVISKYQAWLFMPLLIGLAMVVGWRRNDWGRWLLGFLPVLAIQIVWEFSRDNNLTLLEAQWQSYGGVRLAWSWELWPRLQAWASQWGYILGSPVLELLLLLALPLLLALLIDESDRSAALDKLFALFVVAYSLLLWFVAIPAWDRYVLALLPYVGILLARFAIRVTTYILSAIIPLVELPGWSKYAVFLLPVVLLAFQTAAITQAYRGYLPIGATPSADQGAAQISQALKKEPYGTVLYDHWYSWQWRYHLFDGRVYVSWFPNPAALIEDLRVFGNDTNRRFIALPDSEQALPVKRALLAAGFFLERVASTDDERENSGMVLYLIRPPGSAQS